jgi:hypothetical protein
MKGIVKNATPTIVDGIQFKSKLEAYTYTIFNKAKLPLRYEPYKCVLQDTFKSTHYGATVRAITWTPDFIGDKFIVECKGHQTDAYKIKIKLFYKWILDSQYKNYKFYIVKNQKEVVSLAKQLNPKFEYINDKPTITKGLSRQRKANIKK